MNWTNQKIHKLKELWEQGIIATEIAKIFGTSKNSIIGKANRLNCIPRKQGGIRRKQSQNVFKENPKITPIIELENPTLLINLTKEHHQLLLHLLLFFSSYSPLFPLWFCFVVAFNIVHFAIWGLIPMRSSTKRLWFIRIFP